MSLHFVIRRLGLWLGVALAYALSAYLSLQLPRPDDFMTPVYLPAGVALAAVLVVGARVWPGIMLGALLWGVVLVLGSNQDLGLAVWAFLANPLSVTAQALLGGWLARRYLNWPMALDNARDILIFIALIIPLSCVINASVSIPLLMDYWFAGERSLLLYWLQWWQGDMLGSVLLIPILLVFFGRPRHIWRPRRLGLSIPLLATGLLTIGVLNQVQVLEQANREADFNRDGELIGQQVEKQLDAHLEMVHVLQSFMVLSEDVDRQGFARFVSPFLERHAGAENFSFNPHVSGEQRDVFEIQQSEGLGEPYRILDRQTEGGTARAGERDRYFPILFVEPFEQNRSVMGLDPASIPAPQAAIEDTLASGEPVASRGFRLTQEEESQIGVVVYARVPGNSTPQWQEDLLGLATVAFRMEDVIQAEVDSIKQQALGLCLVDRLGGGEAMRLMGEAGCEDPVWLSDALHLTHHLPFAGRDWALHLKALPEYTGISDGWAMWTAGVVGLFVTGTLGAFLLLITGQARRVSQLVDERTHALAQATDELREHREALDRAQGIARMGSWEVDLSDGDFYASEGLARILHCGVEDLNSIMDLLGKIHHQDREAVQRGIDKAEVQAGVHQVDCRPERDSQRVLRLLIEGDWRRGEAWRLRGIAQDVTEARDAAEKIERLAHYDELTGLPNRTLWLECTRSALESAHRHGDCLGVMFLDLDEFKTINDSLGHSIGDILLSGIAERLKSSIRREDILARLGGDEFVVLLPRLNSKEDARAVAEKMMASLSQPVAVGEHELKLSASIGMAVYPDDGDSVEVLLQHADTAMYRAKESGRNTARYFEPGMSKDAKERLFIESGLRKGLENDEFVLHYQPQIDCHDGRTVGLEALVRWQHPDEGLLMPARFIPAAERSSLIVPLGDWVLRESCRQQAEWAKAGHGDVTVAVNISAVQFRRDVFVKRIATYLEETGADPEHIKLEITESALMDLSQGLVDQLRTLRGMGLTLSLDDFGTGYSSLTYLKRLPISQIKLDRSFVMDLPDDPEDAAIAETAIAMARNLGIQVVAEGVETQAQKEFLLARGCHLMQGFLFAKAISVVDLDLTRSYLR